MDRAYLSVLAANGISFAQGLAPVLAQDSWRDDMSLAMDAQPALFTQANAGIPAFLTNIIDPEVIRVLVTPMRMAEALGEQKKGSWTDLSIQFPIVESAGQVTSYGDFNNNGNTDANINWVPRQSYLYQTTTKYGEFELEKYGLAKLNYKSELDISAANVMGKFQNNSYVFGVQGLQNYGMLTDPNLIAPIAPTTKAYGGTAWTSAAAPVGSATAQEVYSDVLALFSQLQLQMGGYAKMDDAMTLLMSPGLNVALARVSQYNVTARQTIEGNFPNLKIEQIPEYATAGGQVMQLILDSVDGVRTVYVSFNEKMRMHQLVPDLSSWKQKKSGGTWGAIIRRPIAVAQGIGY
ncbi:MAG: hypothetical protein ACYDD1_04710 [Caulobacteraceae bacterium]